MSRIYDSSAITQRRRDQIQAGSFINRIQNPNHPQTSYGPLQGIYDASIMNSIKMGQPKEFIRYNGCVVVSNGCPCPPIVSNEIVPIPPSNVPGPVTNVIAVYGSVIVTWNAPTTGATPTSYTLFADDQTTSGNSVTITSITPTLYTFPTYTGPAINQLTAGDGYLFKITPINLNGSGPAGVSSLFYAPYVAASNVLVQIYNFSPLTIFINFSPYDFGTGLPPTQYTLIQYVNGTQTSTITDTYSTNQIVIQSGLNATDFYSFKFQLSRSGNNKYSSYSSITSPTRTYPNAPTGITYSNTSSTGIQINYDDFSINGYDLTGATCTITNGSASLTTSSVTNTSVIVENLSPATQYSGYTISFSKPSYYSSPTTNLSTIYTYGIAPVIISSDASSATNATIICNDYSSGTSGEFDFTNAIVTVPGASPSIDSVSPPNTISIGNLSPATTYNGCTMSLTGASGATSEPSNAFSIVTQSDGVTDLAFGSSTQTTINLTFTKPASLPGTIQSVRAFDSNGEFNPVTLVSQTELQIGGLSSGTTYYNVYITVSDGTYTSMSSNVLASVVTTTLPPNVQTGGISTGTDYVTIPYDTYNAFYPTGGTLYTDQGTFSSISSISNQEMSVVGVSAGTTYNNCYITLTDGTYTSDPSNTFNFTTQSPPPTYPAPNIQTGGIATGMDYVTIPYDIYNAFYPTGGTLYSNGSSIGSIAAISNQQMTVNGLSSGTPYTNCYITLTDGTNTSDSSSPYFDFTTISPPPPTYPAPNVNAGGVSAGVDYVIIPYETYNAFYPSAGTLYSNGSQVGYVSSITNQQMVVNGLSSGTSYTNCYIVITDGTYTSDPSNTFNFTTQSPPPPPEAPNVYSTSPGTNDVNIYYYQFNSFTPNASYCTLYTDQGSFRASSAGTTSMYVSGLPPGTTYSNCYIQLSDGSSYSSYSNTFNFTTSSPPPEAPNVTSTSPGTNVVTIYYDPFNSFTPTGGTLYTDQGIFGTPSAGTTSMYVSGLPSGTSYNNCYIILSDGPNSSLQSNTFSFTTQSPPPPPEAPNVTSTSPGTNDVTIYYDQYNSFTPNASYCVLYTDQGSFGASSAGTTSMYVSGLPPGTSYNNCYIILSDGANSSPQSNTFNFTT